MNCAEFEILLADYLDGALDASSRAAEKSALLRHQETCASCAALASDAAGAMAFIERAELIQPPPELVAKILHATNSGWELKLRSGGLRGWINRTFAPVLKPRIVMGAMLTLMSITMLSRCAGVTKKTLTPADLDPVRIWSSLDDRTNRLWDRAVKSYESMRLVYEIRTQISDWNQQTAEEAEAASEARTNSRRLDQPVGSQPKNDGTKNTKTQ